MPVFASVSFAPCNAMFERIAMVLDNIAARAGGLKADIAKLQVSDNVPTDRDTVINGVDSLMEAFNDDLAAEFRQSGVMMRDITATILEGYVNDNYPVTHDGMAVVHAALPDDRLEQFRYINLHDFAAAVHECTSLSDLLELDPRTMMYASLEDMYAQSVLTRTTLYLNELRTADGQDEWVRSALCVIGELGETVELLSTALRDMKDALQDEHFDQLAIVAIEDPASADAMHKAIAKMDEAVEAIVRFCAQGKELAVTFYGDNLIPCLEDTQTAINAAYKIYVESNMITF